MKLIAFNLYGGSTYFLDMSRAEAEQRYRKLHPEHASLIEGGGDGCTGVQELEIIDVFETDGPACHRVSER